MSGGCSSQSHKAIKGNAHSIAVHLNVHSTQSKRLRYFLCRVHRNPLQTMFYNGPPSDPVSCYQPLSKRVIFPLTALVKFFLQPHRCPPFRVSSPLKTTQN